MSLAVEPLTEQLRSKALETVKRHKASWIELGQYLVTINKDKLYKTWGFLAFDAYCKKELHINPATAAKMLKSYSFLEKEEPRIVATEFPQTENPRAIPNYESVNLLRLAKENKNITTQEFAGLREAVLNEAREPKDVRARVKEILSDKDERDEVEVRRAHRNTVIKRLVTMLAGARREFESENLLPDYLLKQMSELAKKLEDQME